MTEETTSELLAAIDRDMADIERQVAELVEEAQQADYKTQELPEYTPPEGWRVLRFGEQLLPGDVWVNEDGTERRSAILHWDAAAVSGGRCIRRIKPEPEPVQVREGRWRTRNGLVKDVTAMPTNHEDFAAAYPWWDGVSTWRNDGRWLAGGSTMDLLEYLGPIEPKAEPVPVVQDGLVRDVTHLLQESGVLDLAKAEQQIEELRSEVSYVQRLLGTERRRVAELEELVASLRTINEGQEKAFEAANKENTALRNQLAAVKAELASVAADRQRLQIELDAAQQVPQAIADRFEEGWNQGTARAVETVLEWLQPIRAVDHPNLSNETLQHFPQIMRHLTGLESHAID